MTGERSDEPLNPTTAIAENVGCAVTVVAVVLIVAVALILIVSIKAHTAEVCLEHHSVAECRKGLS